MRFCLVTLFVAKLCSSFTPSSRSTYPSATTDNSFLKMNKNGNDENMDKVKRTVAASFVAASLWASPASLVGSNIFHWDNHILNDVAISATANAKEMASGSGSRVNKDAESLLRYGLPIPKDKEIRKLQIQIEEIRQNVSSKRKSAAIDGEQKAAQILKSKSSAFAAMCRDPTTCTSYFNEMSSLLKPLDDSLKEATATQNGSAQERVALDDAYNSQDKIQKLLTLAEEQMVPKGYVTPVPAEYNDLPQLQGRATVEFILQKPNKAPFDIDGVNFPEAKLKMIIDGYTSPVTGGNFVELVQKGFYNNMKVQRSDGFVVQTGDPEGPADGYVGTPSKSVGKGKNGERLIPSEIFMKGDKGPIYESTVEDEGRGGEATVLPFSSYGAMGWAREEYNVNSGSSQFFWLLFDSDLTPAGKNMLDGRYPCFGYVVEGADFLSDVKEDDVITSAKLIEGTLKQP